MDKWQSEERCTNCDATMSDDDIWMNDGVCPYCAHKNFTQAYASTRVVRFKVIQTGMELGPMPPKWKFWARQKATPVYKKVFHTDDIKREKGDE